MRCLLCIPTGRKRLKCVMDILSDSDEMELVVFTMTLVNKVSLHLIRDDHGMTISVCMTMTIHKLVSD